MKEFDEKKEFDHLFHKINDVNLTKQEHSESLQHIFSEMKQEKKRTMFRFNFTRAFAIIGTTILLISSVLFLNEVLEQQTNFIGNNETEENDSTKEGLISTLTDYKFREIDWFSSEEELLSHENLAKEDAIISADGLTIQNPDTVTFSEVDSTFEIFYDFDSGTNTFVAGKYIESFEDEEEFITSVSRIKNAMIAKFGEPIMGNPEDLESVPAPRAGLKGIEWRSNEGSLLRLHISNNDGFVEGDPPYLVIIQLSAPRSSIDSLLPIRPADENISTIRTVLQEQFTGPDKNIVELLTAEENITSIGRDNEDDTEEQDSSPYLDAYLAEKYKPFFTESAYDTYIATHGVDYHWLADVNDYTLIASGFDISETIENTYDFTVDVIYKKKGNEHKNALVTGRANMNEDGKISFIQFLDDDGLLEALQK
ncbi:hypothetical protein ACERII_09875 [Evansella sp. AB-rgal1]|uniref:hypothetical protein n=1 Tax=Evansella sp. AB-rgal1 TaxID=3242696 RepID=UPI00359D7DD1